MDEHREETLQRIKEVDLDWSGFSLASPVRGSELFKICKEKGYIDKDLGIGDIKGNQYIINAPKIGLEPQKITRQAYLMNLDVNFVNNRQMRIGNYETAAKCFQEVTERYDHHAFAHYYLAQAYEAMDNQPDLVRYNRQCFNQILEQDSVWMDYAEFFELGSVYSDG